MKEQQELAVAAGCSSGMHVHKVLQKVCWLGVEWPKKRTEAGVCVKWNGRMGSLQVGWGAGRVGGSLQGCTLHCNSGPCSKTSNAHRFHVCCGTVLCCAVLCHAPRAAAHPGHAQRHFMDPPLTGQAKAQAAGAVEIDTCRAAASPAAARLLQRWVSRLQAAGCRLQAGPS